MIIKYETQVDGMYGWGAIECTRYKVQVTEDREAFGFGDICSISPNIESGNRALVVTVRQIDGQVITLVTNSTIYAMEHGKTVDTYTLGLPGSELIITR